MQAVMKAVMKAVLPYDATPSIRAILAAVDPSLVKITQLEQRDGAGLLREIATADVLLHVLAPVTAELMRGAPSLRLVHKIGVGVDTIDLDHARANGIAVCNMPGTNTAAVAELTLAMMLACLRRIVPIGNDLRAGRGWLARPELLEGLGEIGQSCVGLIGYGAVSRRLSRVLRALDARVVAYDPNVKEADVELVTLDALLVEADIVSLHVPLTPDTSALLNRERLARMKPGAIIVNTARGPLIDEAALADALASRHISAAGLDVFAQEPTPADNPLLASPHVVAMPHLAWLSDGTWRRSVGVIAENCRRLAADEPLLHRVV